MSDNRTIVNTRGDARSLAQHNSVFTVSNGYLGLKGNIFADREGPCPVTLINGVYDELDMFSLIRASNQERRYLDARHFDDAGRSPAVANLPNPLFVRVFVGDRELSFGRGEVSAFRQTLALDSGLYSYSFDYRDAQGRVTRVEMQRFASARHPHRAYMRCTVTPQNHAAPIRIVSGISGAVHSNTTRERQFAVTSTSAGDDGTCVLTAQTLARRIDVRMTVAHRCTGVRPGSCRGVSAHDAALAMFEFQARAGEAIVIDRYVTAASAEDERLGFSPIASGEHEEALGLGFDAALALQRSDWEERWPQADERIEGDDEADRALRFCLYHVLAAAPWHTDRLSLPVKLLSGEYYQGNTFYDTDLMIAPFLLLTFPELARRHLHWRHVGLEPGRQIASALGFRGAKFAWQAGPYGEECLGKWWRFTHTNIHLDADVAYTLMQYHYATGDDAFLAKEGVDLLVETARFFASRARFEESRGAYHLDDVAGPDEGHCESIDNFFTNYLARLNLQAAAAVLERLAASDPQAHQAAVERLDIAADEPARWRDVAAGLVLIFDEKTKVYEQCRDFYRLLPPPNFGRDRKVWFETVFPYQALNQPDVIMAMMLDREAFPADVLRANWAFYRDKSMNFSSMSFPINATFAAEVGDLDYAYEQFLIAARMDLDEDMTGRNDTYAGLHGTAMGGAWMAAVLGFGGVCLRPDSLRIRPRLPKAWTRLGFPLRYRGAELRVEIDRSGVRIQRDAAPGEPVRLEIMGQVHELRPGAKVEVPVSA
jgi:trehalose/maltose hydrolase-like predicted phosphorylase